MASDKSAQDNLIHVLEKIGHALLEWQEGRGRMGHWKGTQFKAAADQLAHERLTRDLTALFPGIPGGDFPPVGPHDPWSGRVCGVGVFCAQRVFDGLCSTE